MKISVTLSSRERKLLRMLLMIVLPPLFVVGAVILFVVTLPLHIVYAIRSTGLLPKRAQRRRSFAVVSRKSGPAETTTQSKDSVSGEIPEATGAQVARVPDSAPST